MPLQPARRWTNEELFEAIRRVARRLKRPPTQREFDDLAYRVRARNKTFPSTRLIITRFGTWGGALRMVGMTPPPANRARDTRTVDEALS